MTFLSSLTATVKANPIDDRFERLAAEFIHSDFAQRPIAGVALGWHEYDGKFVIPDEANSRAETERLRHFSEAFANFPAPELSSSARHDLRLIQSAIALERWTREQQRNLWRNPMPYASDMDVSVYLKRDFKPLSERIADITKIILVAPAYLETARKNLESILPRPFVETAIEAANGTATFLEHDVAEAAAELKDAAIRAQFEKASKEAVAAFRAYADWLKNEKLPKADNSYGLGREKYVAMLKTELIDLTPEEILEIGLRELAAEQKRFSEAAAVIDPNEKPAAVFQAIQREHPTASNLISDTRKDLEAIRQFVVQHHLVTIPSEVRVRVEETLPPFRSTSLASMDTPGPFETKATEAYYYVTPVEPAWTSKQAEEWLTAFNYYTTDVVTIHEAFPGHYTQFLALNSSPASTAAKALNSYAFVEGWAHYCEQLIIEQGFGQPAAPESASRAELVRGAKYRLAQSSEALLRISRLCCSVKLHCQGMTVDEATRFFVENAHYEEKPARSEAMRGTFDPGYLYYTIGKLMILKLRGDWQKQEGNNFTLQRFHDELLRHGAPPIPLLRQIMLKDPKKWGEVL